MCSILRNLQPRRLIGLLLFVVVTLALLAYAVWQAEAATGHVRNSVENQGIKLESVYRMREQVSARSASLLRMAAMQDAFEQDDEFLRFKQQAAVFIQARDALAQAGLSVPERTIWETGRQLVNEGEAMQERALSLILVDRRDEAIHLLLHELRPMEARILAQLDILIEMLHTARQQSVIEAGSAQARTNWALGILAVVLLGFALRNLVQAWRR